MNCPREIEIDRLLGGSLDAAEASALEAHIGACPACTAERDRAGKEAEAYRHRLAPLRITGGLQEEIMASLPEPLPLRTSPRFGVVRWAAAAAMLLAVLTTLLLPGRKPDPVTPTADPREGRRPGVEIVSMTLSRLEDVQKLLPEELPFVSAELEAAGFWQEMSAPFITPPPKVTLPKNQINVTLTRLRDGAKEELSVSVDNDPTIGDQGFFHSTAKRGTRCVARGSFDRLWSIFNRAMNPLQLYRKDAKTALAVYRGGLEAWTPGKYSEEPLLILSGEHPETRKHYMSGTTMIERVPRENVPFTLNIEVDPANEVPGFRGDCSVTWGWGRHRSPPLVIAAAQEALKPAGLLSMELTRSKDVQKLLPEELPFLAAALEAAGFWAEVDGERKPYDYDWDERHEIVAKIGRFRNGAREDVEITLVNNPADKNKGHFSMKGGGRFVPRAAFDPLWAIVERAMKPLQLYASSPSFAAGSPMPALFVDRGGDKARGAARIFRGRPVNGLNAEIYRDGQPEPDLFFAEVDVEIPPPTPPWSEAMDLGVLVGDKGPGRFRVILGGAGPVEFSVTGAPVVAGSPGLTPLAHALTATGGARAVLCFFHRNDWQGGEKVARGLEAWLGPLAKDVLLAEHNVQVDPGAATLHGLRKHDGGILILDLLNVAEGRVLARYEARDDQVSAEGLRTAVTEGLARFNDNAACRRAVVTAFTAIRQRKPETFEAVAHAVFRAPGPGGKSALDATYDALVADEALKTHFDILAQRREELVPAEVWPVDAEMALKIREKDPAVGELRFVHLPIWTEPVETERPTLKWKYIVGKVGGTWRMLF